MRTIPSPLSSLRARSALILLLLLLSPSRPGAAVPMSAAPGTRMAGQRVLVTGAGRGIGRAIALICAGEGARVAIASRTRPGLEETAGMISSAASRGEVSGRCVGDGDGDDGDDDGDPVGIYVVDVTKEAEVEDMVGSIVSRWGGVDVLVNNAGGSQARKAPMEDLTADDLRRLLDLNVVSVQIVTSAVLRRAMLPAGSGRVVNVSSRAGKVGLPNNSHYVASKFALEGITASLAEEVRERGVTVNTLSPGMVDTKSFPKPEGKKGVRTAESVADGLMALLESNVTGCYLHVDELDEARVAGLGDEMALKPIREAVFSTLRGIDGP